MRRGVRIRCRTIALDVFARRHGETPASAPPCSHRRDAERARAASTGAAFTGRAEPARSARRPRRTGRSQCGTTTEFRTLPTSRPDRASRCRCRRRASACSPSGTGRMNRRSRACSSDRDGSRPSGAAPRRPPRGAVAPGTNAAPPRAGRMATFGGHPTLMAPVPASCRAASRPGAVLRNAGITSAANRSNCSSITDSGVPMLDCTLTASSPGNCSPSSWR